MHPLPLLLHSGFGFELDSDAVLLVVGPLADVLVAVREGHSAIAIFLSLLEVADVGPPILVGEPSLSFEEVLRKGTLVGSLSLREVVHALAN